MTRTKNRFFRWIALAAAALIPAAAMAGCGGSKTTPFQMAFCAPYVEEEAVESYGSSLKASLPELTIDGEEPLFTAMTMGDPEGDPMSAMAGLTRFSGMIAANELDVIVSDMENAERSARSESFLSVDQYLSEEEQTLLADRLLSFDLLDDNGSPTGEKTPLCGIDVSDNAPLSTLCGGGSCGLFIAANTSHPEQAAALVRSLLGLS